MVERVPPQPHPSRLTDFAGHAIVVATVPGQAPLVGLTAASLARATGAPAVYFAYVDQTRYTDEEFPDGTVRHLPINPDAAGDAWAETERALRAEAEATMAGQGVEWHVRYLAGRVDRALTHLARAVDASAIIVGAKHPSSTERLREFLAGSVAVRLTRHQHRPVLIVPLAVIDWKAPAKW